jgi:hypothetical protein
MVHAPAAEKKAVQDGWATKRTLIGSNEFFIVGSATDPAKIAEAKAQSMPTAGLLRPRPSSFPVRTIPELIRKNWMSGKKSTSRPKATVTWSPRTS